MAWTWAWSLAAALAVAAAAPSCAKKRERFMYPSEYKVEVERVCDHVRGRNRKEFTVAEGRVHVPLPLSDSVADLLTTLRDGHYYCGRQDTQKLPCPVGTTSLTTGAGCGFKR